MSTQNTIADRYAVVAGPGAVRFVRLLPGPIERVWSYLVDSDKRGQWLASGEMEPRPGGHASFTFRHSDLSPHKVAAPEKYAQYEEVTTRHRVTRIEPPRLLALTWGGEENPSEVTFELTPEGDEVRLVVTHAKLASRSDMVDVCGGWHTHLAILEDKLNGRTPPAFWSLFGDIEGEYDRRLPT